MPRPAGAANRNTGQKTPEDRSGGNEEDVVAGDRVGTAGPPILTGQNEVGFAEVLGSSPFPESPAGPVASHRVDQPHRPAVKIGRRLDRIAGRARNFGYQRAIDAE